MKKKQPRPFESVRYQTMIRLAVEKMNREKRIEPVRHALMCALAKCAKQI